MKTVVGIGEALWDCMPEGRKFGGAPTNFAYHCGQFGLDSHAVSAVGDDPLGHEILNLCAEKGQKVIMPKVHYPTGTVQVTLDTNGIPQYEIKQDVAWDNIPFTPELADLARRADAVCFGSLAQRSYVSRTTIQQFVAQMRPEAIKVFDINLRQGFFTRETIEKSLEMCNILKINDEELVAVSRIFGALPQSDEHFDTVWANLDFQAKCLTLLKKYDLRLLILTCGVNGSYVFSPDGSISTRSTPQVEVADTVGAGDSFTAAFISSLLQGQPVAQAHERAVQVSAFVCTQHGAMPTLPESLRTL